MCKEIETYKKACVQKRDLVNLSQIDLYQILKDPALANLPALPLNSNFITPTCLRCKKWLESRHPYTSQNNPKTWIPFLFAWEGGGDNAQQTFTYSKSSIETLEKGVKYVQN